LVRYRKFYDDTDYSIIATIIAITAVIDENIIPITLITATFL